MWNKIYLIVLTVLTLVMGVLIYFPYSWLQSKTDPRDVQANFMYFSNISWTYLIISALILLIAANVVLWKTRRSWAIWASLVYFTVFTIAHKFWLDQAFFSFQKTNNLTESIFSFGAIAGAMLIVMAAVIVYFDQYLVKRLHDKMYLPVELPIEELPKTALENENDS